MKTVGIGYQDFDKLRTQNNFYVDKTDFITEWWESNDEVTLITRPRRFGNHESGFGRYDVMLEPKLAQDDAIILEFKAHQPKRENNLEETIQNALAQIEEKRYAEELLAKGMHMERIRKYGFAFRGKEVLIG